MPHPALALGALLLFAPARVLAAPPPASLEEVLHEVAEDRLFEVGEVAVQVVHLDSGEEVFARRADAALSPASTAKVVTAATALKTLGPAYRFQTRFFADALPDPEGRIAGNLYIRGGGDPSMVLEKLWKLVYDLKLAGVSSVDGDLVLDDTFFDADRSLHGWSKPADLVKGPAYFPELSALSLNFNTVSIVVLPGPAPGQPATVRLETPAGDWVELVGEVRTGPARSRRAVRIQREVREGGGMRYTASGSIPVDGQMARYYRTVADPTGHFGAVLQELLRERGIAIGGDLVRGPTPDEAVELVSVQSRSLAALLMDMNKFSSNFFAEQVLRTIGAETTGEPGSTASGLAAVQDYLEGLGLHEGDFHLVNGSGLSRESRLSPAALTAVLVDMDRDPQVGPEFAASLSLAGWDGTLADRLEDHAGLLRGKTGTIGGVHCLAGYITAGTGERYAFAFLANDIGSTRQVRRLHDRFAEALFDLGENSVAEADAP